MHHDDPFALATGGLTQEQRSALLTVAGAALGLAQATMRELDDPHAGKPRQRASRYMREALDALDKADLARSSSRLREQLANSLQIEEKEPHA